MRERARKEGRPVRYDGTWRDRDPGDGAVPDRLPVVRLKAPRDGETVIEDGVQGRSPGRQRADGRSGAVARRRLAHLYAVRGG